MDLSKYRLVQTEADAEWDAFVETSPQGTVFSSSAFLTALPFRPALAYVLKGSERVGGLASIETEEGGSTRFAPHVIHGGLMMAPAPPEQNRAQTGAEAFRVTSAALRDLTERYRSVALMSSPAFEDWRPVLWHNYGEAGPHFALTLRYTTYLDLPDGRYGVDQLDGNPAYAAANKSRRQEIRYGLAAGVTVDDGVETGPFLDLYELTFARQGLSVDAAERDLLAAITGALAAAGRLRVFTARTANGEVGSVAVIGLDSKRAYYLYGANDPAQRDGHCGTMALWGAFNALAADGVRQIDLEGVNSPKRGYFKLSFGGRLVPYQTAYLSA